MMTEDDTQEELIEKNKFLDKEMGYCLFELIDGFNIDTNTTEQVRQRSGQLIFRDHSLGVRALLPLLSKK